MLSVASVKSASGAANYFAKDDWHAAGYYAGEHASEASEWGGKGAETLGLKGEVSKEAFEKILNGELPDGEKVGQVANRQAGMDLTFSMPKSASIMAYVAGDERILSAHMNAVRATMGWVEKSFAEGRSYERTKAGEPVRTGNLVYALFQHDTSRALDPQGHIHAVVANMTKMPDGTWRAYHNGQLWKNNAAIGAAYHAQFRLELAKLGYQTEPSGKHGSFEIKGVPKEVIGEFSQRRAHILARAGELGIGSHKGMDRLTTNTRDPKLNVADRAALRDSWRERAANLGFTGQDIAGEAAARAGVQSVDDRPGTFARLHEAIAGIRHALGELFKPDDPLVDLKLERLKVSPAEARTQHAVASAVRILEEREAAFPITAVGTTAMNLGLAGVTAEKVDARVAALITQEKLIAGHTARSDGVLTHVTTPAALAAEDRILAGIELGKGAAAPIVSPDTVAARIAAVSGDQPLNAGQMAAATLALSSADRIVAVQGVAGAGKSTMLRALARVAESEGRRVLGLAFQNKMVGDLRDGAGIEAQTVSSFVNTYARAALAGQGERYEAARDALRGTVLVLEEASMVGSNAMRHLVGIASELGVDRLVLVGDRQQLTAIDAGKAFALAQAGGIAMARMDENLRQRTDQLRQVAALANRGAAREALSALGGSLRASPEHIKAAAEHWLSLAPEARDKTALFASGRAARAELNARVQEGLRSEGTLTGEGGTFRVLERVNTTREELRHAHTYERGQTLEVARAVAEIGLKRGSYEVLGVDAKGRVEIKVGSRIVRFDPQKIDPNDKRDALGLTHAEEVKLQENDHIRWTQNDKERGLYNADMARVLKVGDGGITVEAADRSVHELKTGDPMLERLGLAYALNMHMAQGITADNGIAVMSSTESNLSNQRLFNVTVTRVRDELTLYTDNKERLACAIERNEGNKTSALETVGRLEVDRKDSPESPQHVHKARESTFNRVQPLDAQNDPGVRPSALLADVKAPEPQLPFPEKDKSLEL